MLRAAAFAQVPQQAADRSVLGVDAVDFQQVPAMLAARRAARPGQVGGHRLGHAVGIFGHAEQTGIIGTDLSAAQPRKAHPLAADRSRNHGAMPANRPEASSAASTINRLLGSSAVGP